MTQRDLEQLALDDLEQLALDAKPTMFNKNKIKLNKIYKINKIHYQKHEKNNEREQSWKTFQKTVKNVFKNLSSNKFFKFIYLHGGRVLQYLRR